MTASVPGLCPRCHGTIVDGACDDCGHVAAGINLVAAARKPQASTLPATRSSNRTQATSSISVSIGTNGVGSASARVTSTRNSTSRRRSLGGGLVSLPAMPSQEPIDTLMVDPTVPLDRRVCPSCQTKVNRETGFCPNCGTQYNFVAGLKAGDLIAGQFEIKGPMAYGGLGWIYLAMDTVLNRWVILKGLLNSKDEEAAAAALAERQFLAAVKHPKIVSIYNFVQHGTEGYIVMEYVGGKTLRSIRRARGPLPPAEAIAYILAVLPAFAYLHDQGLVYCDFKPDNFMLEGDDIKLIDMGAVRKVGDPDGAIFATAGYMAPEAENLPTPVSDLYTIARTLAHLLMDFRMTGTFEYALPTAEEQPVLAQHESLKLFLERGCATNPALRFQNAEEMGEQLFGVLREIVAIAESDPKPGVSRCFLGDGLLEPNETAVAGPALVSLPRLRPDADDVAAGAVMAVAAMRGDARAAQLDAICQQFPQSHEAALANIDALISLGKNDEAHSRAEALLTKDTYDWKAWFLQGRAAFNAKDYRAAAERFARIRAELPGECAAQLALALALEAFGERSAAEPLYDRVSRIDPSYASAAFGAARCRLDAGDRTGAVQALRRVPSGHALYALAQLWAAHVLVVRSASMHAPTVESLIEASETLSALAADTQAAHQLTADILIEAVQQIEQGVLVPDNRTLFGRPIQIRPLKVAAAAAMRAAARLANQPAERWALIDSANSVRPFSIF